jgi:hypothetical protein
MNRTRSLDRRYRRILYSGLAVSAGVHAALIGVGFDAPLLSGDTTIEVERIAVEEFDAVEVVAIQPALTAPTGGEASDLAPAGPVSDASPSPAARSAAASPVASAPPAPAPTVPEVAFEQLTVLDPLSSAPIRPVEFTTLRVAVATLPVDSEMNGQAEDDIEVYVPGSIGAAKRQWGGTEASNTLGGGSGISIFAGGGSGGHCPMPGRAVPDWR